MKRIGLITVALSVILMSCNGQTGKQKAGNENDGSKPQTDVKVNRQYDRNGNLIRYDSTYSYYYSNVRNNKNLRDSILNNFRKQFNEKYPFSDDQFFNDLFFEDSLMQYDFYKKDFFINRFRDNMRRMDSLFFGMDSLKNDFFRRQFTEPGPVLKVPKE